jgi:hypothetical protein
MDLKQANEANQSEFWRVPNAFMKKVRQLNMNELRLKVFELAGALMDQRNANIILMKQIEELKAENQQLKTQPKESVENV